MTTLLEKLVNAMENKKYNSEYYKDAMKTQCIPFYNHLININNKNNLLTSFTYISHNKYQNNEFYCAFCLIEGMEIISFNATNINEVVKQILICNSDEFEEQDGDYNIIENKNNIPISKKQIKENLKKSCRINNEDNFIQTFNIENHTYTIKMKPEIILFDGIDRYQDNTAIIFFDNNFIFDAIKDIDYYTVIYKIQILKDNRKKFNDDELILLFDKDVINKNKNCSIKINSKKHNVIITNNINCNILINSNNDDNIVLSNNDNSNNDDNTVISNNDNSNNDNSNYDDNSIYDENTIISNNDNSNNEISSKIIKPVYFRTCILSPDEKNEIINLLNVLQNDNIKFIQLLDNYSSINIIKTFHYDNIKNINSYHFTGYLYNSILKIRSNTLHFYISNNIINSITEINNLL